jgi:hypothetical protein
MLDNDLVTATSQQWNATIEHNLFGKGVITSVSYVGSRGDHLYSLNNVNQRGSCLLLVSVVPGSPCSPAGGNSGRLNQTGVTNLNRRGNEGFSRYHALQAGVRSMEIGKTGLLIAGTYTWAHSIDNESSFFGDSSFEGNFGFGFADPFNPSSARASSSNDIRHRGTVSGIWDIPYMKKQQGFTGRILGGWSIAGIFQAQTGGAFTVYDGSADGQCARSGTNFCMPVVGTGAIPKASVSAVAGSANTFNLYTLPGTLYVNQLDYCTANALSSPLGPLGGPGGNAIACTAALINLHSNLEAARNQYRTPGIWFVDSSVRKDIHMPWESHQLQLRADFINTFNHSNLYADPVTNVFGGPAGSSVQAHRGLPNSGGKERRNIQLSLRYIF